MHEKQLFDEEGVTFPIVSYPLVEVHLRYYMQPNDSCRVLEWVITDPSSEAVLARGEDEVMIGTGHRLGLGMQVMKVDYRAEDFLDPF